MKEELTKCSKEYLIKQLEYSYKEIERLKNLLQKKWEETSKYVEIADDYEKRLNKAIEYIKNNACYSNEGNTCCDDLYCGDCDKVLDILKGVDKE